MKDEVGFAVVGCGVIGRTHADQAVSCEGAYLAAVVDEAPERAQAFARRYGVPGYSNLEEVLQREDIDVVTVATPSGSHGDVAMRAARAGKHVIVEKPIEVTLEKADAMITVCRENGVKLCVVSQHRFDPSTIAVKRHIDEGRFGKMLLGEATVHWYRSQAYYDSGDWRGTWKLDGGGALMNQSIHTIDLLQHLMGPVERIYAHAGTFNHERIEVEDAAVAVLRFRGGGIGTIVGTTLAYPGLSARVEVFGESGTAVIDGDRLTHLYVRSQEATGGSSYGDQAAVNKATTVGEVGSAAADPSAVSGGGHAAQFIDMIQAIREDREPLVNGAEGKKPLAIILGIYESARTGREVHLPL